MFRAVLYFLFAIVAISLIKAVLNAIGKAMGAVFSPSPGMGPSGAPRRQSEPESLQKDPVCGTFVAPSTAFQKAVGNKTYYFCSTQCRERFQA